MLTGPGYSIEPQSLLTLERPDLWQRGLTLATRITGCRYVDKLPGAGGAILACGSGFHRPPKERLEDTRGEIRREREKLERWQKLPPDSEGDRIDKDHYPHIITPEDIEEQEQRIERLEEWTDKFEKEIDDGKWAAPSLIIPVPEGSLEWLLHEVGHYVVASPEERRLPDYGFGIISEKGWGRAREWQAWGFEEIILAPFGSSRELCAPEHRGGVAWSIGGPMLAFATHHAENEIRNLGLDVEEWRAIYAEWAAWKGAVQ